MESELKVLTRHLENLQELIQDLLEKKEELQKIIQEHQSKCEEENNIDEN